MEIRRLIRLLKDVFNLVIKRNLDFSEFLEEFMCSEDAFILFRDFDDFYFNGNNILIEFLNENEISSKKEQFDETFIDYVAHIYAKFYERTKEVPSIINKYLPLDYLKDNYEAFHLYSEERVIFLSKFDFNLRNNPMRKVRAKSNINFLNFNDSEKLYISREIYLKLFYYPEIETSRYSYKDFPYFEHKDLFFVSSIIKNENDINTWYKDVYQHYIFNRIQNIIVLIIENDSLSDNFLINKIIEKEYPLPFDKVILLRKDHIVLINKTSIETLYFVYTNADCKKALKLHKMRFDDIKQDSLHAIDKAAENISKHKIIKSIRY